MYPHLHELIMLLGEFGGDDQFSIACAQLELHWTVMALATLIEFCQLVQHAAPTTLYLATVTSKP